MSTKTLTFDVPEASLATLDEIAENLGETREFVLREAVALYLADYEDLCADVAEGIRQADAGETISHEEMMARFAAMKSDRTESKAA